MTIPFTGNLNRWNVSDVSGAGLNVTGHASGLWAQVNSVGELIWFSATIHWPVNADPSEAAISGLGGVFPFGLALGEHPQGVAVVFTDSGLEWFTCFVDGEQLYFYYSDESRVLNSELSDKTIAVAGVVSVSRQE